MKEKIILRLKNKLGVIVAATFIIGGAALFALMGELSKENKDIPFNAIVEEDGKMVRFDFENKLNICYVYENVIYYLPEGYQYLGLHQMGRNPEEKGLLIATTLENETMSFTWADEMPVKALTSNDGKVFVMDTDYVTHLAVSAETGEIIPSDQMPIIPDKKSHTITPVNF